MSRSKSEREHYNINSNPDITKIRNIGIIAHIDAGKTTTTERMLYYWGAIQSYGEVHDGNTVMDYLQQERERGITIRAATTSFKWKSLSDENIYQINLIDTPGHVDFTAEVERSLRVWDGAIGIFDAMQGVETQTETVWQQANRFSIPRLGFINKLDRQGADIELTVSSIKNKLKCEPFLINFPIGEGSNFNGIIDIPSMVYYKYVDADGRFVETEECVKGHQFYDKAMTYREELISKLSEYDEKLADKYLLGEKITYLDLINSLKFALRNQNSVALHWGSSLKNRGIQPLLENVVNLLPSPKEKPSIEGSNFTTGTKIYRLSNSKEKLWAFAFKVVADPDKGLVTFFRIYSGSLKNRSKIQNWKTGQVEKITQLFRMTADEITNVEELGVGDIGAFSGWDSIHSGDTFVEEFDTERVILSGVKIPPPVFFWSIESELSRDHQRLQKILRDLSYEDPSISISENKDTGQVQISGMGELHLEILRDRIQIDYGLNSELGPMRVAYRESVSGRSNHKQVLEKVVGGRHQFAEIELSIEGIDSKAILAETLEENKEYKIDNLSDKTKEDSSANLSEVQSENEISKVYLQLEKKVERRKIDDDPDLKKSLKRNQKSEEYEVLKSLDSAPSDIMAGIEQSINQALESGNLLGYPVINTKISILDGKWSSIRSDPQIFKEWTVKWMKELFSRSNKKLLEPYMNTEIEIPNNWLGDILSNISGKKNGKIIGIFNVKAKFTNEIGKYLKNIFFNFLW